MANSDGASGAGVSVSTTTGVAAGATGSFVTAKWIIACIVAGHMVTPDDGTLAVLCAAVMPIGHMIGRGFMAWLSHKTGVDVPEGAEAPQKG